MVLGWGYWHVSTHADVHVALAIAGRKNARAVRPGRACYDAQSRWFITWVRRTRSARVRFGACTIEPVPVALEESRDAWWLWWVPAPHIDNSASTHFNLTLWIDSARCSAAGSVQ
jgi:hypothetical protein